MRTSRRSPWHIRFATAVARTAAWYAEIPNVVKRYPQLRAVALWSGLDTVGPKNCDYRWQNNADVSAGVASAGAGMR